MSEESVRPVELAVQVVGLLQRKASPLVLAESCTGGMVAALLTQVPGASHFFCGSAVTYREPTKIDWLDIEPKQLKQCTAVSDEVTQAMAIGSLHQTPEAKVSAAITGHLGPGVDASMDGRCFLAVAARMDSGPQVTSADRLELTAADRVSRQHEAALGLLQFLLENFPNGHR